MSNTVINFRSCTSRPRVCLIFLTIDLSTFLLVFVLQNYHSSIRWFSFHSRNSSFILFNDRRGGSRQGKTSIRPLAKMSGSSCSFILFSPVTHIIDTRFSSANLYISNFKIFTADRLHLRINSSGVSDEAFFGTSFCRKHCCLKDS